MLPPPPPPPAAPAAAWPGANLDFESYTGDLRQGNQYAPECTTTCDSFGYAPGSHQQPDDWRRVGLQCPGNVVCPDGPVVITGWRHPAAVVVVTSSDTLWGGTAPASGSHYVALQGNHQVIEQWIELPEDAIEVGVKLTFATA